MLRLLRRVKKETEARQLESVAECGRVRAMLRRSLARLGHTRRDAGDTRPLWTSMRCANSVLVGHRR